MIYLPVEWLDTLDVTPYLDRTSFCAVLPRIFRTEDEAALREMLVRHRQVLAAVAVSNLGHLPIAEGLELPLRGDLGMNVFNSRALLFLRELGLSTAAVSFELRHQQIRDLKKYLPCEAVVYGRLPLMLMENCVIANSLGCCDVGSDYRKRSAACRCTGENVLTDRTGARFPLMPAWGHRNELENSRTLFLGGQAGVAAAGAHLCPAAVHHGIPGGVRGGAEAVSGAGGLYPGRSDTWSVLPGGRVNTSRYF